MEKRRYIRRMLRMAALAVGMVLTGGASVWGQTVTEIEPDHEITDVLYVIPSRDKEVTFQANGEDPGIDGYVRWYTQTEGGEPSTTYIENTGRNTTFDEYDNGYVWYNTGNQRLGYTGITCNFPENVIENGVTLVYDASSVQPVVDRDGNRVTSVTPRSIGIRHIYQIRDANDRARELSEKRTALQDLDLRGNDLTALAEATDKSHYVLNSYEVYTPKGGTTNFRLPENLDNYYVDNTPSEATQVRYTINIYDGSWNNSQETSTTSRNIINNILKQEFSDDAEKAYILVEVSAGGRNATWYPVSFITVTLVDYAEALTAEDLEDALNDPDKAQHYQDRDEDELERNTTKYEQLVYIPFEFDREIISISRKELKTTNNFATTPFEINGVKATSYYAFGNPAEYANKYLDRVKVAKGEYSLFRTLNYPGISKGEVTISSRDDANYNDYFITGGYRRTMVDRLWEKTVDSGNTQSGYFMYVDASEVPGVITQLPIDGLCPNTSLIVNAWICDMSWQPGNGATRADVGFTLKKKNNDGTEIILAKYYSGTLNPKPAGSNGEHASTNPNDFAKWQQVSFKFSFTNIEVSTEDQYILEISSNCESSTGADFGIDEISLYRTLPNISVQRESACEYSTLKVSSDYETLLKNMGWNLNPDVLADAELTDVNIRKFRYGLMGSDPSIWADGSVSQNNELSRYLGNVYFGFVEEPTVSGSNPDDWVTVNKRAMENTGVDKNKYALYKSIRVAVPTNGITNPSASQSDYVTTDPAEAQRREYMLNVRAMHDFVADVNNTNYSYWDNNEEAQGVATELETALETLWNDTVGDADADAIVANSSGELNLYEQSVIKLFNFLGIPRVRCPWRDENATTLYLNAIEVGNTDLHFAGEIIEGQETPADGKYWVVLFSAVDVANAENSNSPVVTVSDDCTLKSEFYVVPSITIAVDTKVATGGVTCVGSIHTLSANLMVADVDEVGNVVSADMVPFDTKYPGEDYTFDWYLGSEDDYNKITEKHNEDLQSIIEKLRDGLEESTGSFDSEDVKNSSSLSQDEKTLLNGLLGDETHEPLLITGKTVSFRWVEKLMAIPYVPIIEEDASGGLDEEKIIKLFCTKPQELTLNAESNVPELSFGFSEVDYPDDVELFNAPLRLGLRHIKDNVRLSNIPIREDITFGVEGDGHSLQELGEDSRALFLRNTSSTYTEVGTLNELYVDANEENNNTQPNELSFTFKNPSGGLILAELFEEGGTYDLYVPFGEYDANGDLIPNSCEGYAILRIKVVPEYLTWTGEGSTWYNDEESWTISTSDELYGKVENTVSTPSFSPLYFTKITVLGSDENISTALNELKLEDERSYEKKTLDFTAMKVTGETTNIQYDMAVANDAGSDIRPYYGNWVDQIYFKPNATLYRQDYLTYNKAWVDFEMTKGTPYWMASPLKDVYAGDMYAPSSNGQENHQAFSDITYNDNINGRWELPFYQKAWDKAITYSNVDNPYVDTPAEGSTTEVDAVQSNWSIEYNDVWVPYSIGKGFYARVEEKSALVRLPKADPSYTYETKALSPVGTRTNSGQLADKTSFTVDLTEDVDGDGTHFLVGNPYMAYLDMNKFFSETNLNVLAKKYWTLAEDGSETAAVGTPDVEWTGGAEAGYIAPMRAFFVEKAQGVTDETALEITFSPDMVADKETATTTTLATKSYEATNPQLILTASSKQGKSVSVVTKRSDASNQYESDKDAVTLLDSELDAPTVYTVAGNYAAAVNAIHDYKNVPLTTRMCRWVSMPMRTKKSN